MFFNFFTKSFKNFALVISFSTILTLGYIFFINHQKYLTHITVNPFYECSEDMGMWVKRVKKEPQLFLDSVVLQSISTINFKKVETPKSMRRPLRFELAFYSESPQNHNLIIKKLTYFLDSLNRLPTISYEERAIIKKQILLQDSLINTNLSEKMKWEVLNYKNHKIKELKNNYYLNFQYLPQAQWVNTLNWSWIISFYIIPLIFWMSYRN